MAAPTARNGQWSQVSGLGLLYCSCLQPLRSLGFKGPGLLGFLYLRLSGGESGRHGEDSATRRVNMFQASGQHVSGCRIRLVTAGVPFWGSAVPLLIRCGLAEMASLSHGKGGPLGAEGRQRSPPVPTQVWGHPAENQFQYQAQHYTGFRCNTLLVYQ